MRMVSGMGPVNETFKPQSLCLRAQRASAKGHVGFDQTGGRGAGNPLHRRTCRASIFERSRMSFKQDRQQVFAVFF